SRQKAYYLPEPHNDFIFSVIAEETGFLGGLIIIFLFAIFDMERNCYCYKM
ncbi:Cell division protein FtsW, partial [Candidatus Arthromitus sp. SFB-4]